MKQAIYNRPTVDQPIAYLLMVETPEELEKVQDLLRRVYFIETIFISFRDNEKPFESIDFANYLASKTVTVRPLKNNC